MPRSVQHAAVTDVAAPCSDPPHWYALWLMSNAEFMVERALDALGVENFLPTYDDTVAWSDRTKLTARPLFKGYIFARLDAGDRVKALRVAGVIDILPTAMQPIPIDQAQLENVRRLLDTPEKITPCEYVTGDLVLIERGPLAGIRGVVQKTKNGVRVVVAIEMLQRAVSVECDAADVAKAAA